MMRGSAAWFRQSEATRVSIAARSITPWHVAGYVEHFHTPTLKPNDTAIKDNGARHMSGDTPLSASGPRLHAPQRLGRRSNASLRTSLSQAAIAPSTAAIRVFLAAPSRACTDDPGIMVVDASVRIGIGWQVWGSPAMIVRLAALAPTSPPETGASSRAPAYRSGGKSFVAIGDIELISTTTTPGETPAATPSLPNKAAST